MKTALIIIAIVILSLVFVCVYYGAFKTISPKIKKCGGETLVFEKVTGHYKQSGEVSDRVYNKLIKDYNIETTKGFGLYFDNPKEVEESKLRSEVGCILERKDTSKLEDISKDFLVGTCPNEDYIVAEFPFKGKMSIIFGIMKVYPALNKFAEENGYSINSPVMEIWDVPNKKTIYRKKIVAGR